MAKVEILCSSNLRESRVALVHHVVHKTRQINKPIAIIVSTFNVNTRIDNRLVDLYLTVDKEGMVVAQTLAPEYTMHSAWFLGVQAILISQLITRSENVN